MKMPRPLATRLGRLLAAAGIAASLPAFAQPVPQAVPPAVTALAAAIAAELAAQCPLADADDTAAFEGCRAALDGGHGVLRAQLPPVLLWGRQDADPRVTLRQTHLTQFAPDTWTRLYAPLFMFNGRHQVDWVPGEQQYVIRLEAAFRNRLAPGQFPHPFWHEAAEWATYQNANGVLMWVHPQTLRVQVAQFTSRAANPMLHAVRPVEHRFDGQWLWTDTAGRVQPAVTLFEGLFRPENPHLRALDRQYRDLALQMREAQCSSCHVPSNPDGMSRLVLLSSPAHAAGEIDRLIRSVREDRRPGDPGGNAHALERHQKEWLLQSAQAFKATVDAARDWEAQAARPRTGGWQPVKAIALQPHPGPR